MEKNYIPGHTGKIIYLSQKEATHVMTYANHGRKMRIYKCEEEVGLHWHLTTMSKAEYRELKKQATKAHRPINPSKEI